MTPTAAAQWLLSVPLLAAPAVYLAGRAAHRIGRSAAAARWLALLAIAATMVPA